MYKVFINFRGNIRNSFISHLKDALTGAGINTIVDHRLRKGRELGPELMQAIQGSQISLVVFSKEYTKSHWCLNELVKIMECRTTYGQLVLPIFYNVRVSVVGQQQGAFGKALEPLAQRKYPSKEEQQEILSRWRTALTQASKLTCFRITNYRNESELVKDIVDNILTELGDTLLSITENQSMKDCVVGIGGMDGLGKTTTAKAIDNQIHSRFVDTSFIENNRQVYGRDSRGIIDLQEQLLVSINVQNNMDVLAAMLGSLSKLASVLLRCDPQFQLSKLSRTILDHEYGAKFTESEISSYASQISKQSLRSYLIGIGSYQQVSNTLNSISEGLTNKDSCDVLLPGDNLPCWLTHTSEGRSVFFVVPQNSDSSMKGMALCVVYSSSTETTAAECLVSVLIINYTKCTIQIYKRDTVISFNDEDWQGLISNLRPGDQVEIFATFGHKLAIKKTAVFLIYDEPNNVKMASSSDVLVTGNGSRFCAPPPCRKTEVVAPLEPKENGFKRFIKRLLEKVVL